MWKRLCIDEVKLCEQMYTILSNADKKDGLIAMIPWTKSEPIIKMLLVELWDLVWGVEEISSDMWPSVEAIIRWVFPNAIMVTDRFHVMKLLLEDLQNIRKRVKTQLKIEDNEARLKSKKEWLPYLPRRSILWETLLETVTMAMYQCNKRRKDWNHFQKARHNVMCAFGEFSSLVSGIDIIQRLFDVFDYSKNKDIGTKELRSWLNYASKIKTNQEIKSMVSTIELHFETITNYFVSRHSTWYAEWLHSRIRELIQTVRWFKDKDYMFYRILKMFS